MSAPLQQQSQNGMTTIESTDSSPTPGPAYVLTEEGFVRPEGRKADGVSDSIRGCFDADQL